MCRRVAGNDVFQQQKGIGQRGHAIDDGPNKIRDENATDPALIKCYPTVIMHLGQISREKQEQTNREINERTAPHLVHAARACVNQNNSHDSYCPENLYVISPIVRHHVFFTVKHLI